jgi:hypothetical protein
MDRSIKRAPILTTNYRPATSVNRENVQQRLATSRNLSIVRCGDWYGWGILNSPAYARVPECPDGPERHSWDC